MKMRRHGPHGMKSARLGLLVLHGYVAEDRDQRFGFMMRFFYRAPARQGSQCTRNFLSGHVLKQGPLRGSDGIASSKCS